jgi:CDP-6-deoxy-D-xylo-4-hexulose-3-dehydrase
MTFKFPLATSAWGQDEYEAIQRVILSGMFTMGEHVEGFEKCFAKYSGSKYCVMVNSGSSAILLMIAALFYTKNPKFKLNRGDEIIVPAVSWSTTYFPLYQYGLKIKFIDIDLHTLNYDLNQLEQAITNETRAIMVVNLLGNPNDFIRINQIICDRNILLIEDNCESMGAKYNKKHTGTFGLMGAFSSFFSHHISTMEGGLIVTDNEELYQILLSLRAHGWTRNLPKRNFVCDDKSDDPFEESFRFVLPGYNLRPLELSGAIGVEQVKRLPFIISARRENAKLFQNVFSNHQELIIQEEISESSWFGFSLVIRPGSKLKRKDLIQRLNELGFECRPIVAGNFTKNEVVKYFNFEIHGALKNAEHIDQNGLFIGNHHYPIPEAFIALGEI